MKKVIVKIGLALLVCIIAFTLAVELSAQTPTTKARNTEVSIDCVSTANSENLTAICDTPNPLCHKSTDRTKTDCAHRIFDIPKAEWPNAWGQPVAGRLLSARYVDGHLTAVSACSNLDMLQRQMKRDERGIYARNPINAGPPNPCLRGVSGFIGRLLGE